MTSTERRMSILRAIAEAGDSGISLAQINVGLGLSALSNYVHDLVAMQLVDLIPWRAAKTQANRYVINEAGRVRLSL